MILPGSTAVRLRPRVPQPHPYMARSTPQAGGSRPRYPTVTSRLLASSWLVILKRRELKQLRYPALRLRWTNTNATIAINVNMMTACQNIAQLLTFCAPATSPSRRLSVAQGRTLTTGRLGRIHGRDSDQHRAASPAKDAGAKAGYVYLHSAVDGFSRLSCQRLRPHRRPQTRHQRTRPCTPRHNGKTERYPRIMTEEVLYARVVGRPLVRRSLTRVVAKTDMRTRA